MTRHEFDPISFLFGSLFIAAAAWVLVADSPLWSVEAGWIWPVALLVAGLFLLGSVVSNAVGERRNRLDPLGDDDA